MSKALQVLRSESCQLRVILLLAVIHGLIYVLLVPAWQHNDEPNHFEYVGLAARLDILPKPGDYDQQLSYQIVESMVISGFFDGMAEPPVLESPDQKVIVPVYSQLDEPPLYYIIASLPQRLMLSTPIKNVLSRYPERP